MTTEIQGSPDQSPETHNDTSLLLSGIPDFSDGRAEEYFRSLNE